MSDQIQWQPSTDQTLYQSVTSLLSSTFYRLTRGFHRLFATGVACWQGTLTLPDTWSRPNWDLHIFYLLRPILFPNLYFLLDYSLRTSLGTFSILLCCEKTYKSTKWHRSLTWDSKKSKMWKVYGRTTDGGRPMARYHNSSLDPSTQVS